MSDENAQTLVESLRDRLGDGGASSFQLMGEDLGLLTGADLSRAAEAYAEQLAQRVPAALREAFEAEHIALVTEANRWLRRYNRNVHTRIAGYVELGRSCDFIYPWPVVAILGICSVLDGMERMRFYGLVGGVARRFRVPVFERVTEGIDDVLRRTNRGIFADSVPTVLWALHCDRLRRRGDGRLAEALLDGPLLPLMDETCRREAVAIYRGLALEDEAERFATLARITLEHFGREQAVFTHHIADVPARGWARSKVTEWMSRPRSVRAPRIQRFGSWRRVAFSAYRLPRGFDMRDHDRRVEVFGRAFVSSVTASREDYATARDYVLRRFG